MLGKRPGIQKQKKKQPVLYTCCYIYKQKNGHIEVFYTNIQENMLLLLLLRFFLHHQMYIKKKTNSYVSERERNKEITDGTMTRTVI
jgi:hypothetical protein